LLLIGLSLSTMEALPTELGPCEGFSMEGNSILYLLAKWAVFGRLLPVPAQLTELPVLYGLRMFLTGYPFPAAGTDVIIHPIAFGAWAGLLVTGINLIPVGQLDGGHLLYVLLGNRVNRILPYILVGLVVLGVVSWMGWWLLALLLFFFNRKHAEPLDAVTPLSRRHRMLALLGPILFLLLFTPVPLQVFGG
jgi:membrane-associated protease RseP (regulator of RpoE activity)